MPYFIDRTDMHSVISGDEESSVMHVIKVESHDEAIEKVRNAFTKRFPFGVRGNVHVSGAPENGSVSIATSVDLPDSEFHNRVFSIRTLFVSETKPF